MRMFFLLFVLCSWSHAEVGFYPSLPSLPQVDEIKTRVYHIFTPTSPLAEIEKENFHLIPKNQLSFPEINGPTDYDNIAIALRNLQLLECLSHPDQNCIVGTGISDGTGFFLENGSTFYSAFHTVPGVAALSYGKVFGITERPEEMVDAVRGQASLLGGLDKIDPYQIPPLVEGFKEMRTNETHVLVFNSEKKIIYGKHEGETIKEFDFPLEHVIDLLALSRSDLKYPWNDFSRIKFAKNIGEPLSIANSVEVGSVCFSLGYPIPTDRSSFEKPSSQGNGVPYFSTGSFLNFEGFQARRKKEINLSSNLSDKLGYCSSDGNSGNSGGPLLNQKGEVSAIVTDFFPQDEDDHPISDETVISIGPNIFEVLEYFTKLDATLKK